MAAERLVETVELFKDRLVNIMANAKEAAEAAGGG